MQTIHQGYKGLHLLLLLNLDRLMTLAVLGAALGLGAWLRSL